MQSAFERRARGVPGRGLLDRILRAVRPLRPEPVVLAFPGRKLGPSFLRRHAILVPIAPLVAAALVVCIGSQVGLFRSTNLQSSPQASGIVHRDDDADADAEDAEGVADEGDVAGRQASDREDRADHDDEGDDDRDDD